MSEMRAMTAAEQALGLALPTRRDEEWKWTDLRRLVDRNYSAAPESADASIAKRVLAKSPLAQLTFPRVIIANGRLQSAPPGITVEMTAPEIVDTDPLLDLNGKLKPADHHIAFSGNIDQPVEVVHVTTGQNAAIGSRMHFSVAEGSSATVIETFVGDGDYLHNPVTTIELGKGARLDRIKLEAESASAQHLSHVAANLAADARYNDFTLTTGAVLSRQNGTITFNGQHASANVSGSYLLNGKQHVDTRLVVDHKVANCVSRELFKCVMDGNSRGIFQGKVIVRPDAQKTDGKQSSHALLLSEMSEFDAKPELEIYADDVVCGHGTTCGDLNHDHLFYLRSRGIPTAMARAMLVEAFVAEAIDTIENELVKEALLALVHARMA